MRRVRSTVLVGSAGAALVAGVVAAFLLRDGPVDKPAAPVNNVAGNYRACLITSATGSASAKAVWKAMQEAAATGRVNAQSYVAPAGSAAIPYLNGVVGVGCNVVIVAESRFSPALENVAAKAKQQHFLVVGSGPAAGNVEVLGDAKEVSGWIAGHAGA